MLLLVTSNFFSYSSALLPLSISFPSAGLRHMYHDVDPLTGKPVSAATCAGTYGCGVYDPEGVLGWVSAAWMTFLGLQAGRVFVNYRAMLSAEGLLRAGRSAHLLRWAFWGVVVGLIGAGLAGFSKDDGIIPIKCVASWRLSSLPVLLILCLVELR